MVKRGPSKYDYVNTWPKLKQESVGWPSDCVTEEERRRFIERFEEREGIRLEKEKVTPNPGLKATAKLMPNSFWGKFGEKTNKSKVEQVKQPAQLYRLLWEPANTEEPWFTRW